MGTHYWIYCYLGKQAEKAMAPHSSTLAWKIPWMEEPGGLQSMGSQRVRHDWATSLSLSCIGEGNGNPLQCSCLENPRDGGAWWAAISGVTQSWTQLKQLSSSSSRQTRRPLLMWGFSINEIHDIWVWIFTFPMDLEFLGPHSCLYPLLNWPQWQGWPNSPQSLDPYTEYHRKTASKTARTHTHEN